MTTTNTAKKSKDNLLEAIDRIAGEATNHSAYYDYSEFDISGVVEKIKELIIADVEAKRNEILAEFDSVILAEFGTDKGHNIIKKLNPRIYAIVTGKEQEEKG